MGVGSDHEAGAAVAEIADRLLLARGFAVEIDHHRVHRFLQRACREFGGKARKRIVNGVMKTRPIALTTSARLPFLVSISAAPRPACRSENWPGRWKLRRALDKHQSLALIPGVIAERDRIRAGIEQFLVIASVIPMPAAFSPLTTTSSSDHLRISSGSCSVTAVRPARPTTSPTKRINSTHSE